ncbi:homeodomain-like transcriptional regulator [Actinidia rufa]|uniref:Homeodomain-like transcriptional regulator n=1 Tax=Actinidia rufa TaxID=165716 RepID=A0A7J0GV31_9ERIC|nr:homeodomain-like transcriptional regulator [Actinidia rufa]
MKVYDLAKSSRIVNLNLAATSDELELLISSTLSSDITLFEKISHSAYRLRILSITKEVENFELDPEDCGSIDEYSNDHDSYTSSDDSEYDPGTSALSKLKREDHCKTDNNRLTVDTEIDESHPGEVWLFRTDGSIRMEDTTGPVAECVPNNHYGSGAKIKRASVKQHKLPTSFGGYCGQMLATKELDRLSGLHPKDSSASISTYNRYWLFLGPCNANDPGHKSVYFESSEDGHWEVVDTEEALCTLLSALDCREKDSSSSAVSDVDNNHCLTEISKDVAAPSGAIVVEAGNKGEQQKQKWSHLQAFDAWIWSSFYYDLNAVKYGKKVLS